MNAPWMPDSYQGTPLQTDLQTISTSSPGYRAGGKVNRTIWTANVVLPPNASKETDGSTTVDSRGVVLFLHGFNQRPEGYKRLLTDLAQSDVLIVAPRPSLGTTSEEQQKLMVHAALFWRECIDLNQLPGINLVPSTRKNVGLLGHSLGGGLAPYIVDTAARTGRPFTAAHLLAPFTDVMTDYRYDVARGGTMLSNAEAKWGVQYGRFDLISLFPSVEKLCKFLSKHGSLCVVPYTLGTHLGFQDQPVIARQSASGISQQDGGDGSGSGSGPGIVQTVREQFPYGWYVALASSMSAVAYALPGGNYSTILAGLFSVSKIVLEAWAVVTLLQLFAILHEGDNQRETSREHVVKFFSKELGGQKSDKPSGNPRPSDEMTRSTVRSM